MAKSKVSQADTPYSITVESSDESTGKVAQQETPVTYSFDNGNTPSGNAKTAQEPSVSVFDSSVTAPTKKAVEASEVEDKAVGSSERKSTRGRR